MPTGHLQSHRAVLEAGKEVQVPRLLAMLCVLAVFRPVFFMVGVSRALFVAALAVARAACFCGLPLRVYAHAFCRTAVHGGMVLIAQRG